MLPPGSVKLIGRNGIVGQYPKPTDDYDDPLNWSTRRKIIHYGIILIYVGVSFAAIDIWLTGSKTTFAADLSMSAQELELSSSFRYIGQALGGIVLIPLAYRYGRRPIYLASLLLQLVGTRWIGLAQVKWEHQAASTLIGAGVAVAHALVPITITDLFFIHQFATAFGFFIFTQGVGSFTGPTFASFIAALHGNDWRWMPRSMTIALAAVTVIVFFGVEESTFVPKSDPNYISTANDVDEEPDKDCMLDLINIYRESAVDMCFNMPAGPRTLRQRFAFITHTDRPIRKRFLSCFEILVRFPGVAYAALTFGSLMAWQSLLVQILATQAPFTVDDRSKALFNLGPMLAHALGTLVLPPLSDRWVVDRARLNRGIYEPEMRLWFGLVGGVFLITGFIPLGISITQKLPLLVSSLSYTVLSVGFGICLETALTYITDCYHNMIGDALVGVIFVRNAISALIWVGIMPWVGMNSINNAFIITTVITSAILLLPVPLLIWGRKGRAATTGKYKEYSLAATPPASLSKIMGENTF